MKKLMIACVAVIALLSSCKKENTGPQKFQLPVGVFILNQGVFNADNASITYFEPAAEKTYQSLFQATNGASLGDVAQSITVSDENTYIVVNNSGLIYCIDNQFGELQGKISGLTSPRNILLIDDQKAYVSDLYNQNITIVNPTTFKVTGEIPVERTSEEMILIGQKAYVANYSAWSQDKKNNVVLVIDVNTDELVDTIQVGVEPQSMVADKDNNFWVLCSGGYDNEEFPTLWKIRGTDGHILKTYTFDILESSPVSLEINGTGNRLFFLNNALYSMPVTDGQLPTTPMISPGNGQAFGFLGVDPVSGDIYIGNPRDYQSFGTVYRYAANGLLLNEIDAGLIPAAFGFNQ